MKPASHNQLALFEQAGEQSLTACDTGVSNAAQIPDIEPVMPVVNKKRLALIAAASLAGAGTTAAGMHFGEQLIVGDAAAQVRKIEQPNKLSFTEFVANEAAKRKEPLTQYEKERLEMVGKAIDQFLAPKNKESDEPLNKAERAEQKQDAIEWLSGLDPEQKAFVLLMGSFSLLALGAVSRSAYAVAKGESKGYSEDEGFFTNTAMDLMNRKYSHLAVMAGMAAMTGAISALTGEAELEVAGGALGGSVFAALLVAWKEADILREPKYSKILEHTVSAATGTFVGAALAESMFNEGSPAIGLTSLPAIGAFYVTIRAFNQMSHNSRAHVRALFREAGLDLDKNIIRFLAFVDSNQFKDHAAGLMQAIMDQDIEEGILGESGLLDQLEQDLKKNGTGRKFKPAKLDRMMRVFAKAIEEYAVELQQAREDSNWHPKVTSQA